MTVPTSPIPGPNAAVRSRTIRRTSAAFAVLAVAAAGTAACAEKNEGGDGSTAPIAVTSSNDACDLASTDASTGQVSFTVENTGDKVTEFYVYGAENRVLGEVENIGPGLKGTLTVDIASPGDYQVACKPGMVGQGIGGQISVSGEEKPALEAPVEVESAKAAYLDFVRGQTDTLVDQATEFADAVKAGDKDKAKAMYGQARTPYERIEPVAESFADLDPKIDMRWDDTEDGASEFTGFHRLERYLWPPQQAEIGDAPGQIAQADADHAKKNDTPENIAKIADQLVADVTNLRDEVAKPDFVFETRSYVAGPQALVDEIAATKVGGEEDRYSHTDLWDFAANIEGSQRLITDMAPIIDSKSPEQIKEINDRFADVSDALDKYREGEGYRDYSKVPEPERKTLSDKIDALSASLSEVPGAVLGG